MDRMCVNITFERRDSPPSGGSINVSNGYTRSTFLLVIDATKITGELRLIGSGETMSAGRSPPCSDPTTGFKLTRMTSPRLSSIFNATMDFLLKGIEVAFQLNGDVGHVDAARNNFVPQRRFRLLVEPILN